MNRPSISLLFPILVNILLRTGLGRTWPCLTTQWTNSTKRFHALKHQSNIWTFRRKERNTYFSGRQLRKATNIYMSMRYLWPNIKWFSICWGATINIRVSMPMSYLKSDWWTTTWRSMRRHSKSTWEAWRSRRPSMERPVILASDSTKMLQSYTICWVILWKANSTWKRLKNTPKTQQRLIDWYQSSWLIIINTMDNYFLFLMITMVISGSINTLGTWSSIKDSKFQNQQLVTESGVVKYFYHPYMQVLFHIIRHISSISLLLLPFPSFSSAKGLIRQNRGRD